MTLYPAIFNNLMYILHINLTFEKANYISDQLLYLHNGKRFVTLR